MNILYVENKHTRAFVIKRVEEVKPGDVLVEPGNDVLAAGFDKFVISRSSIIPGRVNIAFSQDKGVQTEFGLLTSGTVLDNNVTLDCGAVLLTRSQQINEGLKVRVISVF